MAFSFSKYLLKPGGGQQQTGGEGWKLLNAGANTPMSGKGAGGFWWGGAGKSAGLAGNAGALSGLAGMGQEEPPPPPFQATPDPLANRPMTPIQMPQTLAGYAMPAQSAPQTDVQQGVRQLGGFFSSRRTTPGAPARLR